MPVLSMPCMTMSSESSMKILRFTVRMLTPAFLGDAQQNARWRTPPFKHALREWWRVAYAASRRFDVDVNAMRRAEGLLFGNAWLENEFCKSQVRMRLEAPTGIAAKDIWHGKTGIGVNPLPTGLDTSHAWFGLINRGSGQPDRQRLDAGETRILALAFPDEHAEVLQATLRLLHAFATLGSRSRGGWGSVHLEEGGISPLSSDDLKHYAQPLARCLSRDWAASLAMDDHGRLCVWRSKNTFQTWDQVIAVSARIRRRVRTALKSPKGDLHKALGFAGQGRMPGPLRWKVFEGSDRKLRLQVAAFPHALPQESGERMDRQKLVTAWQQVIDELDLESKLNRLE